MSQKSGHWGHAGRLLHDEDAVLLPVLVPAGIVQQGSWVQMPSMTNQVLVFAGARKKETFQLPLSSCFRGRVEGSQLLNVPARLPHGREVRGR